MLNRPKMFNTIIPVLVVLCYPHSSVTAVQLTPYKYTNVGYGEGIGKPFGLGGVGPQPFGVGGVGAQPFGPGGVGAQPHGYGYYSTEGFGPLGHQAGLGYKGEVLGHGYPRGIGYGGVQQGLGPGYYRGAVGYGPGIGYSGYGPNIGYSQHPSPILHPGPAPIAYGLGGHFGGGHLGGSQIDQNAYDAQKNSLSGQHHSSSSGHKAESLDHGDAGYKAGQVAQKDVRGESVSFKDVDGVNNGRHEGKTYRGGEHFDKEGKHAGENVLNENHKKGHNVKSFKKSHHLDESGKTEEYYDEDHDEGGNYAFGGHVGKFGETAANSYKGGFDDGKFTSGEHKKEGHFGNEYSVDKVDGEHGKFGENKFARDEHVYGADRGVGEHGLGGHQQSSGFFKKYPQFY